MMGLDSLFQCNCTCARTWQLGQYILYLQYQRALENIGW